MTATNHTLTGMLLLAAVPQPAMLVPAFLAHFVLDALPHFGAGNHTRRSFILILFSDMAIAASFLLAAIFLRPENWPLMVVGGVACASPDLMWLGPWLRELREAEKRPFGALRRFHSKIQWGERPWGIIVELFWLAGIVVLLANNLQN